MATRRNAARMNPPARQDNDADEDEAVMIGPAPAPDVRGQADDDEPEEEPDNGPEAREDPMRGEKADKIDLRNIKSKTFDGTVPVGQFDAKAADWWDEFSEQVEDAQLLAGQAWSDQVKKAVLMQFLTGMARRWFREWRRTHQDEPFDSCGAALVNEFRPNLLHADIAEKLRTERKKWDETYREYADRLMQMADALEDGARVESNARQALVSFTRNAYPRYTDFVESKVNLRGPNPASQLAAAVSILSDKAGTDGRGTEKRKPSPAATPNAHQNKKPAQGKQQKKTPAKNDKKNEKKRPAEANAAVVERKKPRTAAGRAASGNDTKKSIVCYECGQTGHTAAYCRKFLQGQGLQEAPATANQAVADDSSSEDDDE